MNKTFKAIRLPLILAATVFVAPTTNADEVKNTAEVIKQNPGMAIGTGVGATLGGPPGALIGAGIGVVGDNVSKEGEKAIKTIVKIIKPPKIKIRL